MNASTAAPVASAFFVIRFQSIVVAKVKTEQTMGAKGFNGTAEGSRRILDAACRALYDGARFGSDLPACQCGRSRPSNDSSMRYVWPLGVLLFLPGCATQSIPHSEYVRRTFLVEWSPTPLTLLESVER